MTNKGYFIFKNQNQAISGLEGCKIADFPTLRNYYLIRIYLHVSMIDRDLQLLE
jgi:hypothetical protein